MEKNIIEGIFLAAGVFVFFSSTNILGKWGVRKRQYLNKLYSGLARNPANKNKKISLAENVLGEIKYTLVYCLWPGNNYISPSDSMLKQKDTISWPRFVLGLTLFAIGIYLSFLGV